MNIMNYISDLDATYPVIINSQYGELKGYEIDEEYSGLAASMADDSVIDIIKDNYFAPQDIKHIIKVSADVDIYIGVFE